MMMQHEPSKLFVFYESRKRRMAVGVLEKEKKRYKFHYFPSYLAYKMAIPIGPKLPLRSKPFYSISLFPEFEDRIPSKHNPAYNEYCLEMKISIEEKDPLILLATIGSRGPSDFIFRIVPDQKFSGKNLKEFRQDLGLTIHDFAALIDSDPATISRTEQGKLESTLLLKYCEYLKNNPKELDRQIHKRGMFIHTQKIEQIQGYLPPKRTFILGAGFSHHISGKNFPLTDMLWEKIKEEPLWEECFVPLSKRYKRQDSFKERSMTEVLTLVDLLENDRSITEGIKDAITQAIQKHFSVWSIKDKIKTESQELIAKLFRKGDTVITLNYDVLLEHLICLQVQKSEQKGEPWYYHPATDSILCGWKEYKPESQITILKPQGSFNFFQYCYKGKKSPYIGPFINTEHPNFLDSKDRGALFPGMTGRDHSLKGDMINAVQPLILPTHIKLNEIRSFLDIRQECRNVLQQSTEIIIIGISLRPEDTFLTEFLHAGINEKKKKTYHILNSEGEIQNIIDNLPFSLERNENIHTYVPEGKDWNSAYNALIKKLNSNP